MKEIFISFAVFVICVSLTIFSQFNSPQVVNAAESETKSIQQTPLAKPTNISNNNLFELDPSDPNHILFAMAEETPIDNSRTTESGLIISDIVNGEGDEAIAGQRVTVNYTGTLEDGTQFDTSIGRAPFSFP